MFRRIIAHMFAALVFIVNFLLAKHYPEEFRVLKPLAPGGSHDNPKQYLLMAHEQLQKAAVELERG